MTITEGITINKSPAVIFDYLIEVKNRKDYIPALEEVIMLDPMPLKIGSRYIELANIAGRRLKTTYQVIELIPNKRIIAKTLKSVFPIQAQLELNGVDDEAELIITLQLQLKGIFKLASGIIQGIVRQQTLEILSKIKRNLES